MLWDMKLLSNLTLARWPNDQNVSWCNRTVWRARLPHHHFRKTSLFFIFSPHCETYGILIPRPGMELVTKWKHQVLTTGLPGNSRNWFLYLSIIGKTALADSFLSIWNKLKSCRSLSFIAAKCISNTFTLLNLE